MADGEIRIAEDDWARPTDLAPDLCEGTAIQTVVADAPDQLCGRDICSSPQRQCVEEAAAVTAYRAGAVETHANPGCVGWQRQGGFNHLPRRACGYRIKGQRTKRDTLSLVDELERYLSTRARGVRARPQVSLEDHIRA